MYTKDTEQVAMVRLEAVLPLGLEGWIGVCSGITEVISDVCRRLCERA